MTRARVRQRKVVAEVAIRSTYFLILFLFFNFFFIIIFRLFCSFFSFFYFFSFFRLTISKVRLVTIGKKRSQSLPSHFFNISYTVRTEEKWLVRL